MTSEASNTPEPNDIAIVGMALRFPGAHGLEQFWSNLRSGVESVQAFTDEELLARGVPEKLLRDPAYVKRGPLLDGFDRFDAEFFGFSPKEAAILDPQHREFLECSYEALEDSGHSPASFEGAIGVFGGCGMSSYFTFNLLSNPALVESVGLFLLRHTGNDKDFLTTRVSYCLDLTGPSINVQTACSTSLVAVHVACQSLLGGECDMALAGGVTVEVPQGAGYLYKEGEILSPDGHCRVFDRDSRGTIFGSGVGIVVLRRLEDAVRDGDRIYAVIKGSAVNSDGARKVGYLAPSVDGQAAAVAEALACAGVGGESIEYVEAHGTGTPIGDPIEVAALTQALGRVAASRPASCGLGSVKANIGHLDTAAGVASLIKVALAIHHGEIPPTPNFGAANPAIQFQTTPFYVVDRLRPWPRGARPRRAGVNSLGVGGTNAHVVLEEGPLPMKSTAPVRADQLLCLSAKSAPALEEASKRLARHLRQHPEQELADVAHTLFHGRQAFDYRCVLLSRDREEAAGLLESHDPRRVFSHTAISSSPSVVFLLPGGGAQHARMGCELYESEPAFREHVDRGLNAFERCAKKDLRSVWISAKDEAASARELQRPSLQLPAIFILEHALAQFWISLGVRPDALIGHSLGENTAACLAGVLSFEEALGMVALRGELFERLPAGGMISVALAADEIARFLGPELDLAATNAPSVSVVSGPTGALEDLARRLVDGGVDLSRIPITTAAHSRVVESILPEFLDYMRSVRLEPPQIPFVSNFTGTWITPEQATNPEYWVQHLRGTVRFSDGLRALFADTGRVFLEVGPGKALSSLARQQPNASSARGVFASLRHAEQAISDSEHVLTTFGRLWACGVPIDPSYLWRGERRARVSLPTYPFQHRRYWIDAKKPTAHVARSVPEPRHVDLLAHGFYRPVWKEHPVGPPTERKTASTWLVFLDSAGVGDALVQRLRSRGDTVVTVRESDDNCRLGANEYVLAPERGREGYTELVRDLVGAGLAPDRVVHLWLLTRDESHRPGSNFFHRNQERGFYSLFFLAQSLAEDGAKGSMHITVVGNGMHALDREPLLHPAKATVAGPCKVIPREFPGVSCSILDLPLAVSRTPLNGRGSRNVRLDALVDAVEAEALATPRDTIALVRDGRRYEQTFERTSVAPADRNGHAPVRDRGVYLVTGGVGGLGLEVAAHLARQAHVRVVLVGRTPFPDRESWDDWLARHGSDDLTSRRIRSIQAIEHTGAEIVVACADVTDIEAMRHIFEETQRRFGKLNGVIHAAGVVRDAPILTKTQQEVEDVFAPKVHGTLVLDSLLDGIDLDFFVLFSSVSALVAPPGQIDYVAASSFMDAYARSVDGRRKTRTVSVNWGVWRDVGMALDALSRIGSVPAQSSNGRAPHHPFFESRHSDPDGPIVLESRLGTRTHWILDEHRTRSGRAVVPGAAYIEMARAALVEAGEPSEFEMQDLLLLHPLHVPDGESREVSVELRPDPQGYGFQVRSRPDVRDASNSIAWTTHAQARIRLHSLKPAPVIPLEPIGERCAPHRRSDGPLSLPAKQDHAVRFGARWRNLRDVRLGAGEVLGSLELEERFGDDLEQFGLHPALLDIAASLGLELTESTQDGLWVPVSYTAVRVHAPLPRRVSSWVTIREPSRADAGVLVFDVAICDESGRACVELEEFTMRRVPVDFDVPTSSEPSDSVAHASSRSRASSPARRALEHNVEHGIQIAEGMEALQRILGSPSIPQLVATSLDLDDLYQQMAALGELAESELVDASEAPPASSEPATATTSGDAIERTLSGFWRELLGVTSVSVRDNFFDLGGHSLIAVRLFARIKKTYHVDFPISLLFEAPTIERCAEVIRRAVDVQDTGASGPNPRGKRYAHLVPMHPGQGGDKTPFFLVAGMFGNVLNLRHLAHLLGNERRFYGLQALGLYGADEPHETFEQMAEDYLKEVRQVQPAGPYLLGGFSGGGITAYEMARQLIASGEEVALLAMLDTGLPRSPRLTTQDSVRIHWERIRQRGPLYVTEWARDKLRWKLSQFEKRRRAQHDVVRSSEFRSEEVGAAFLRALSRYEVERLPIRVALFRPKIEIAHVLGPGRVVNSKREFVYHDNGWEPYVEAVDVHEVPGTHDSMVLEPNVRVLAIKLRECIQSVETRQRARGSLSVHDVARK